MKPFGVCLLRLFLSLMRLFIHILGSCPFPHTVLDTLSYASFVTSLNKFTCIPLMVPEECSFSFLVRSEQVFFVGILIPCTVSSRFL